MMSKSPQETRCFMGNIVLCRPANKEYWTHNGKLVTDWIMPSQCSSEWAQAKGSIQSTFFLKHFLSSEFTCLCILLNILQFFWKPSFVELISWRVWHGALRFWSYGCTWHRKTYRMCRLSLCSPDCIQSIAAVWRTVRETERGRERGWCTTTPLTASQWDSTWELPSVPCAWILCTLVAKLLPVWVS